MPDKQPEAKTSPEETVLPLPEDAETPQTPGKFALWYAKNKDVVVPIGTIMLLSFTLVQAGYAFIPEFTKHTVSLWVMLALCLWFVWKWRKKCAAHEQTILYVKHIEVLADAQACRYNEMKSVYAQFLAAQRGNKRGNNRQSEDSVPHSLT